MSQVLVICKIGYVPLAADSDEEVVPSNIAAIRHGLEALQKEDAGDRIRAKECWQDAREALVDQSEDDTGAGAIGKIGLDDDFGIEALNNGCDWPYY